jgi:hypothetical protein
MLPTATITKELQHCSHKVLSIETDNRAFASQSLKQYVPKGWKEIH